MSTVREIQGKDTSMRVEEGSVDLVEWKERKG
jgi:hypothetical protein